LSSVGHGWLKHTELFSSELGSDERTSTVHQHRNRHVIVSPEKQTIIVNMIGNGSSAEQIAATVGISKRSVYKWIKLIEQKGEVQYKKLCRKDAMTV
jgi:DNA-binding NarL/FixJ family response regulator